MSRWEQQSLMLVRAMEKGIDILPPIIEWTGFTAEEQESILYYITEVLE